MTDRTRNHIHNCMSGALTAAQEIHIAMCRVDEGHAVHANFDRALHNVLIVAEECRQALQPEPKP